MRAGHTKGQLISVMSRLFVGCSSFCVVEVPMYGVKGYCLRYRPRVSGVLCL